MKRMVLIIIFILLSMNKTSAQLQKYNHPELKWQTIETDHFYVHFHQEEKRTALLITKIAEDIYGPVTSLYEYIPDGKIHFIVRDHDDDSNGAAFYYDNKIEVWAPAMDFPFRGTHNWLRNVITHEFSHIISLGAARKMPRQIPAIYLQWMDYEKEKRSDVIHGYPNKLVSFPLAGTVIPLWFAEGMAQFQRDGLDYDRWDSHRDMILRTAVLEGELISITEMSFFRKNSLGNERGPYNQGYGLTTYLVYKYGEEVLKNLSRTMKSPLRIGFNGAVKKILGISEKKLYEEWVSWSKKGYINGTDSIRQNLTKGKILEGRGIANFFPVWSPDGKSVAYISNKGRDYFTQTSLCLLDLESGKNSNLMSGVTSSISWSNDGEKLVYAKKTDRTQQGSHYYDIYIYDLVKKKEKRITKFKRARQPDWSGNGKKIVCVVEIDGTSNLFVLDTEGKNFRQVTKFKNGEQIFSPRWLGNSGEIVFSLSEGKHGRDIAVIDSNGSNFRYLKKTEHDERDPFPHQGGKSLYYSSDRTGIFNIYELDLESGKSIQVTNVLGGAFMPSVDLNGRLLYSLFKVDGYKIASIDSMKEIASGETHYISPYDEIKKKIMTKKWDINNYDDHKIPEYNSRPYKTIYSKLSFLPRIMIDYPQRVKLGTYFYGSDFLDRIFLLGGVAVNGLFDTDIFGIFEYRKFYPTLFLEAYYQKRHTSEEEMKIGFDLAEIDFGADWRLSDSNLLRTSYIFSTYNAALSFWDQGQKIKFNYTYHIGNAIQLKWTHRSVPPSLLSSIAPSHGRSIVLDVQKMWNRFFNGFFHVHPKYGTLVEDYNNYSYEQILLDWREYVPSIFKNHSLALRLRAGIIDRPIDSFYNFFAGGLDGFKGYPYYSIEGRKLFHFGMAYRFPIYRKMGLRFLWLTLDNMFISVYGDIGNAWDKGWGKDTLWKKDVGIQLRLGTVSFYNYPMKIFFDAAYGPDKFYNNRQKYGGEWRTYFGILFDFLD